MKKIIACILILAGSVFVNAQTIFNSGSMSGQTGLISVSDAAVAWESSDFGMDGGYRFSWGQGSNFSHYAYVVASFMKQAEIGMGIDLEDTASGVETDFMAFLKWNFYKKGGSRLAFGCNYQADHLGGSLYNHYGQLYFAMTYQGNFFDMPAKTSLLLGYTFQQNLTSNIDFGIGFELNLVPQYLKNYVHLLIDYANYAYVTDPVGVNADDRGVFNVGVRINALASMKKYGLFFDVTGTDLLDSTRGLSLGVTFGGQL